MMTPEEQVEYQGLAATVGRLMHSLKVTEEALAHMRAERDALLPSQDEEQASAREEVERA